MEEEETSDLDGVRRQRMVRYDVARDWAAKDLGLAEVAPTAIRLQRDLGSSVSCESRVKVTGEVVVVDQGLGRAGKQQDAQSRSRGLGAEARNGTLDPEESTRDGGGGGGWSRWTDGVGRGGTRAEGGGRGGDRGRDGRVGLELGEGVWRCNLVEQARGGRCDETQRAGLGHGCHSLWGRWQRRGGRVDGHVDCGLGGWRRSVQAGSAFLSFGSQGRPAGWLAAVLAVLAEGCPPAMPGAPGGVARRH